ncbi:MAG: hypothetical protein ACLUGQ_08570 [Coprococcus sp.]
MYWLTVVLFLVGFGLLMIYSTSSYEAKCGLWRCGLLSEEAALFHDSGIYCVGFYPPEFHYQVWKRFDMVALVGSIVLILFGIDASWCNQKTVLRDGWI